MLLEEIEQIDCMDRAHYLANEDVFVLDTHFTQKELSSYDFDEGYFSKMMMSENEVYWHAPASSTELQSDCMWNGHSGDRRYETLAPALQVQGQQSLLKPPNRANMTLNALNVFADPNSVLPMMMGTSASLPSLHTPPISDDEEMKPTQILRSLQSALSDNELDDADLSDYFKEGDEWGVFKMEEEDVKPDIEEIDMQMALEEVERKEREENEKRAYYAATDHSYHKGSSAVNPTGLGIETPSDSEEEIDVVSVDKFSNGVGALPNNPSTSDRRHIQRTMQSRFPQGVKTLMPRRVSGQRAVAAPAHVAASSSRRAAAEPKEKRHYNRRGKGNQKQGNKRRSRVHSTDSDEPSDKRHLHNNMERQRRIDLRNLFAELKRVLPDNNRKTRAAKVQILRGATAAIEAYKKKATLHVRTVEKLKREQLNLRIKLTQLRREVVLGPRH